MVREVLLAGLVAFLPVGVQAQGRGAMAPVSHAAAVAPTVAMAAPHAGAADGGEGRNGSSANGDADSEKPPPAGHNRKAL